MNTIYQVDSFTSEAFRGNPAAVCLLNQMPDDDWLQNVAAEMNLSETAFLVPASDAICLRWFTPTVEVDLCGHATLASAHILAETGALKPGETVRFETLSGSLEARIVDDGIELNFPATPPQSCEPPQVLLEALQVEAKFCGKTQFDFLIEVADESIVNDCCPNFDQLRQFGSRGVMITAPSTDQQFDFISRFFAPGVGIDEDPVTGSAHCALAPYWQGKLGKSKLTGYQASKRGGVVRTIVDGERVRLVGSAVTVLKCELLV